MEEKYLFVLAKSSKPGGLCVAGLEAFLGENGKFQLGRNWIRPVVFNGGAIPAVNCVDFNVTDLVKITFDRHAPQSGQPENWLWSGVNIETIKSVSPGVLKGYLSDVEDLWFDSTTEKDHQVSMTYELTYGINDSLRLVQPQNLTVDLVLETRDNWDEPRKKVYANFTFNGRSYTRIPLTDPKIRRVLNKQFSEVEDEVVTIPLRNGDAYWLTVSLSTAYGGNAHHYVLVAGVVDHNGYMNRNYNG